MPTVGWILEKAVERFWESQPNPVLVPVPRPVFTCSRCGMKLSSPEELRRHLSLEHPLELPALYVHGNPLPRESVLRAPVGENDVQLFHCSRCEVQVDGAPWQDLAVSEFRTQFSQPRNSTWNVRLVHERPVDNSQTIEEYHVRFRIPHTSALNAVDTQFIRTLVLDELRPSDLEQFEAGLTVDAPAREYGSALGDYALGIILKERRRPPHAPVDFAEFVIKMRSALETLRHFHRPVALAVSSSIRFNLNDFRDYGTATATELEAALRFFRSITSAGASAEVVNPRVPMPQKRSSHVVCPVDEVTHRLLSACGCLSNEGTLSLAHLEQLRQLARGMIPVSEQDLVKVHVICAEGYLRLARISDARPHLRAIQFDSVFKDWAQHCLEGISTNGE